MDPETLNYLGGWIGAIAGAVIGVLGGVFGTWASLRAAQGPRERAFLIRAAIGCCVLIVAFLAAMLLIPTWHKHLLWLPYSLALGFGIRAANKAQARIRKEETEAAPG